MSADVLVERDRALGTIVLNRPRALNALTLDMVRTIAAALDAFEADDAVRSVLIDGEGTRGLCAGGDIRALHDAAKSGDPMPRTFWREEYAVNLRVARFPKPVVAIMDGIVMGGGVGLSGHAAVRVATPALRLAMPEVGIGFAPDVGGTWLLSRAPGELGTHAALTGGDLSAGDAIACGLADGVLDREDVAALVDDVAAGAGPPAELLRGRALPADRVEPSGLARDRGWIDACYPGNDPIAIVERLAARPEAGARAAAAVIATRSPTAVTVTLQALRRARDLPDLAACLEQEYRVSCAFLEHPDFVEGIRAAVVDKDRDPRWSPARLEDVGDVERFFAATRVAA